MPGKAKADRAAMEVGHEIADARSTALVLMSEALARLDGDINIPPAVGARLQAAIDALWTIGTGGQRSIQLH